MVPVNDFKPANPCTVSEANRGGRTDYRITRVSSMAPAPFLGLDRNQNTNMQRFIKAGALLQISRSRMAHSVMFDAMSRAICLNSCIMVIVAILNGPPGPPEVPQCSTGSNATKVLL